MLLSPDNKNLRKMAEGKCGPLVPLHAAGTAVLGNQGWNGEELSGTPGNVGERGHEKREIVIPSAATSPSPALKTQESLAKEATLGCWGKPSGSSPETERYAFYLYYVMGTTATDKRKNSGILNR